MNLMHPADKEAIFGILVCMLHVMLFGGGRGSNYQKKKKEIRVSDLVPWKRVSHVCFLNPCKLSSLLLSNSN